MSPQQFVQDRMEWIKPVVPLYPCSNCGARVPQLLVFPDGRKVCCAHCFFNPLGCRCKYKEYGVAETNPDYGLGEEYFEDDQR